MSDDGCVTRVEWTRLQGDDVEAVIAMFVNRERPNSTRITPSRGDGGVDILDRRGASDGGDGVHQVKRYTAPLSAKQRAEVEGSLDALSKDPRWQKLDVREWFLATPWDPTPEAESWLQELGQSYGVTAVWRGLTWADQLAARYPDIIDYYLHGGQNRVDETYAAVMSIFAIEKCDDALDVPSFVARVQKALPALDTDPHYRYELRFGEGDFPEGQARPGLMMTWMAGDARGGPWAAVDIIARCASSEQVRPITLSGTFVAEPGSDFEKDLKGFVEFGAPFTSPIGAYNGEIDAPGGFGGRIEGARVAALPVDGDVGANPELHVQLIDPVGAVVASADLIRTERSQGKEGVRVVLTEVNGAFTIEDRYSLGSGTNKRTLTLGALAGRPATIVHSSLNFLLNCRAPNIAQLSVRHTPPELGSEDPNWRFLDQVPDVVEALDHEMQAVEALITIQHRARSLILVPDLKETPPAQIRSWLTTAELLNTGEVSASYPQGQSLVVQVASGIETPTGPFGVAIPLQVLVGEERVDLGKVEVWLTEYTLLIRQDRGGQSFLVFTTPDRSYKYRLTVPAGLAK